ncbi:MAG: DUF3179 domain-containing (seleno)protein [Pseudomonadota bacterium]
MKRFALICLLALTQALHPGAAQAAGEPATFATPPPVPDGPLSAPLSEALGRAVAASLSQADWDARDTAMFDALATSGDPRLAWVLVDMMRFTWRPEFRATLTQTTERLLNLTPATAFKRAVFTDHLIAWDVPSYPGYLAHKRAIYTTYLPGLDHLFAPGDIAWHMVSSGGVNIDARPFGAPAAPCDCIPAIDTPQVTLAPAATWLEDDAVVFGVSVGGAHRAYPRRIMEVREMVNDTLGGRDLGIPYCTLCGAAQAYFTDQMPPGFSRPVLRTSGLLIRSNKVMYDLNTSSVFDTFRGRAVTGPLAEAGVRLDPVTVITTTWGAWKAAHPDTTVLVEADALGRDYDLRNTRDADGPIFPIGDVDPRLGVHDDVLGVIAPSGQPVAFVRAPAMAALRSSGGVEAEGIRLSLDAGGIKAVGPDGADLGSHQAFWFAWSQFYPETLVWPAP